MYTTSKTNASFSLDGVTQNYKVGLVQLTSGEVALDYAGFEGTGSESIRRDSEGSTNRFLLFSPFSSLGLLRSSFLSTKVERANRGGRRVDLSSQSTSLNAGLPAWAGRLLASLLLSASLVVTGSNASAQVVPPANDAFASAVVVSTTPTTLSGTIEGATTETGEPQACVGLTDTVWYRFEVNEETPIEVTLEGGGTSLALYTGSDMAGLKLHDCLGYVRVDVARVGFTAFPGTTYYLQVGRDHPEAVPDFTLEIYRFDEPEPYSSEPAGCSSRAFKLFVEYNDGPRSTVWYLNRASVPNYLNVGEVKTAIREALKNIAESRNDCGLVDKVAIRTRFGGTKNVRASNCYGKLDKLQVIQFTDRFSASGRMCGGLNAYPNEADIWVQAENQHFTTDPLTTLCRQGDRMLDLEGLLTHELGHAFGLDHPNGVSAANLTMYFSSASCSSAYRTLGLGDVLGLRRLY